MKLDNFKNKKIIVMGLGLHGGGLGVTEWLARKGAKLIVTDLKDRKELEPSLARLKKYKIKYVLGRHRIGDFRNVDMVIQNPAAPRESKYLAIARKNNIPIETDISLFFQLCPASIIGVTGTKGKSTVVTLLDKIFRAIRSSTVVAGNIRVSPLKFLSRIKKKTPVILELSSWQLEGIEKHFISPHLAVITNIMSDHLNRYQGFKDYLEAKKNIFKFQEPNDFTVLNRDNKILRELDQEVVGRRFWFSRRYFPEENGCYIKNGMIIFRSMGREKKVCSISDIKIQGIHNLENVLASVSVAMISKIPVRVIRSVIKKFKGLPDRLELIRDYQGIQFYNDTTATTPEATQAALNTLYTRDKKIILIAGGTDKKLSYKKLAQDIKKKVKALVLFKGTATVKLKKNLGVKGRKLIEEEVESMKEAVKRTKQMARVGDIVLLSPGAASFGLFQNEFDRGRQFVEEVRGL